MAVETGRPAGPVPFNATDRVVNWLTSRCQDGAHMHCCALLRVAGPAPTPEVLRAFVTERAERAPVLAYRADWRRSSWVPASGFVVGDHLRWQALEPEGNPQAAALSVLDGPLPPDRPLWDLTVLHGYDPGEYTLCWRADHRFQDGMSQAAVLEALFGDRRLAAPTRSGARPPGGARRSASSATGLFGVGGRVDLAVPWRRTARWSPNERPLTGRRVLHSVTFDPTALRETVDATGASLNQVCLAALAGALRAWTPRDFAAATATTGAANDDDRPVGHRDTGLAVLLPLNLRPPDRAGALGNQAAVLRVVLPCALADPLQRLRHVTVQTSTSRMRRHRARNRLLAEWVPYRLARLLLARYCDRRYLAMGVTTVPVQPGLAVLGAPVRQVTAVAPLPPGHRVVITLTQYGTSVTASLLADAGIAHASSLLDFWVKAAEDLHRRTGERTP
ncbi:WS/DGAT domain-containing protein [Actinomadura opuntiae]|uniref:WS/DGAT domain-containing protein n=1 Tax=Actinomadura sp. OS1-43 TaxID=604315 RepID=UPI00255AF52D|nr:WS/DGAT domain-containing protein [Actinomadura sp. OS1-43]MDL4816947.1 WS/DGAT domain-containing protein [Actinomadura sp. OS1-43]